MELGDYFAAHGSGEESSEGSCYNVDSVVKLEGQPSEKTEASGLASMLDKLFEVNPAFAAVHELKDLEPENVLEREVQAPVGYSAVTRVHMGRLCVPMLNDSGATCCCLPEETVILLLNHTMKMLEEGKISMDDYNYPIAQIYRYKQEAYLKGAEAHGKMAVEFAISLNVEFIPEGSDYGPVKQIYFKIFKRGTSGIIGGVLGWPTLDHPHYPGGEGLGWVNHEDRHEYKTLGVSLPRLDDQKKAHYYQSLKRYAASGGCLHSLEEESCKLIDASAAERLRASVILMNRMPEAKMAPIGLGEVVLNPGERAVLPVEWSRASSLEQCSTHPSAPAGLVVLPGPCSGSETMSIVVENESSLPLTITEEDRVAIGASEGEVPSLESLAVIQDRRAQFHAAVDWKGGGEDVFKEVPSTDSRYDVYIVIHKVPRFACCGVEELPKPWHSREAFSRITTLTYENGEIDYVPEYTMPPKMGGGGLPDWFKQRPWCGQTAFVFEKETEEQKREKTEPFVPNRPL